MSTCVFFDLDETILNCKSLLESLRYYHFKTAANEQSGEKKFQIFIDALRLYQDKTKATRYEMNRYFYEHFRGIDAGKMRVLCKDWFEKVGVKAINDRVLLEIKKHQAQNRIIAIVSGSFEECVHPIAAYLQIDHVICTKLIVKNGLYSGDIGEPVIGRGKADRINDFVKRYNLTMKGSFAYGDHKSDISMLKLVDNPVMVGSNQFLLKHGVKHGWQHIA